MISAEQTGWMLFATYAEAGAAAGVSVFGGNRLKFRGEKQSNQSRRREVMWVIRIEPPELSLRPQIARGMRYLEECIESGRDYRK